MSTATETPMNPGGRAVDAIPTQTGGMPFHRDVRWERGQREDEGLAVEFYYNKVTEKDHCRIMFPGDDRTEWDQPVREDDKLRFPRRWHAYQNQSDVYAGQTRIEAAPFMDPGLVREVKARQIHTVEQLAAMSDEQVRQSAILGLTKMRARARVWLDEKRATEGYDELKAENASLAEQFAEMQAELKALRKKEADRERMAKVRAARGKKKATA